MKMGGYSDTPENRAKLEAMTRERWDRLSLEPQYRWILLSKRMIADGCPDPLEQIGVDDVERSQIIGAYNQRRLDSHAKKRLVTINESRNLTQENRSLSERVSDQEQELSECKAKISAQDKRLKRCKEKINQQSEDLAANADQIATLKIELQQVEERLRNQIGALRSEIYEQLTTGFNSLNNTLLSKLNELRKFEEKNAKIYKSTARLDQFDSITSQITNQLAQFSQLVERIQRSN